VSGGTSIDVELLNAYRGPMGGRYADDKRLTHLGDRDIRWLKLLSNGVRLKDLPEIPKENSARNRLMLIRQFMNVRTTAQAVAEAIRRGIIK
jgi:hypothetical protein